MNELSPDYKDCMSYCDKRMYECFEVEIRDEADFWHQMKMRFKEGCVKVSEFDNYLSKLFDNRAYMGWSREAFYREMVCIYGKLDGLIALMLGADDTTCELARADTNTNKTSGECAATSGSWSELECSALLDALKLGSSKAIIARLQKTTSRSEKSIIRKLKKIGYTSPITGKYRKKSGLG